MTDMERVRTERELEEEYYRREDEVVEAAIKYAASWKIYIHEVKGDTDAIYEAYAEARNKLIAAVDSLNEIHWYR